MGESKMRKVAVTIGAALFALGIGPLPTAPAIQQSSIAAAELTISTYREDPFEQCMIAFGCTKFPDGTWGCPTEGIYELCSGA
jgi:hypothetical protein